MSGTKTAETDWLELTLAIRAAMEIAKVAPGTYGGRYVARQVCKASRANFLPDSIVILPTDDSEHYRDEKLHPNLDILVHAQPTKCYPIGHARQWIREDGTVKYPEIEHE
jgi:hypothetical protein